MQCHDIQTRLYFFDKVLLLTEHTCFNAMLYDKKKTYNLSITIGPNKKSSKTIRETREVWRLEC